MNKFAYILIFALSLNMFSVQAQDTSFLATKYHSFLDNVKLIKKCYFQKSMPCTKSEREKANQTIAQGGVIAAAVLALVGGYYGVQSVLMRRRTQEAKRIVATVIPEIENIKIARFKYPYEGEKEELIVTIPDEAASLYGSAQKLNTIASYLSTYFPGMGFSLHLHTPTKEMLFYKKLAG